MAHLHACVLSVYLRTPDAQPSIAPPKQLLTSATVRKTRRMNLCHSRIIVMQLYLTDSSTHTSTRSCRSVACEAVSSANVWSPRDQTISSDTADVNSDMRVHGIIAARRHAHRAQLPPPG